MLYKNYSIKNSARTDYQLIDNCTDFFSVCSNLFLPTQFCRDDSHYNNHTHTHTHTQTLDIIVRRFSVFLFWRPLPHLFSLHLPLPLHHWRRLSCLPLQESGGVAKTQNKRPAHTPTQQAQLVAVFTSGSLSPCAEVWLQHCGSWPDSLPGGGEEEGQPWQ